MFEAKLANAGLLKTIFESIKDLVTDVPFDCSETGISLQAMDSSHVALVRLKLERDLFVSYKCDRKVSLGLSLTKMLNSLRFADSDDTCMITYDRGDMIGLKLTNSRKEKSTDLIIKMVYVDSERLGIPQMKYDVVCEMNADEFQNLCKNMLAISCKTLNIKADKSSIVFTGKGDSGSSVVTYRPVHKIADDIDAVSLKSKKPVNAYFSLKFLSQFTKMTSLTHRVRLLLCTDAPIVVECSIEGNGFLQYYLAPILAE